MALKSEYDGDATKAPGVFLAVARNKDSGDFLGFYALTDEGTFVRASGTWVTAKGKALQNLHLAQLVEMKKSFVYVFDRLDKNGETPTEDHLKKGSTVGRPASWDSQSK